MDIRVINTIYTLLLLIRSDINNSNNIMFIDIIITQLQSKTEYQIFKQKLLKITDINDSKYIFINSSEYPFNESTCLDETKWEALSSILIMVLCHLRNSIYQESYEYAYDLVDAIHGLPEALMNPNRIQLKNYWKIYIDSFQKKWKTNIFNDTKYLFK